MTSINKNVKQQIRAPVWHYYEEINENTAKCIKCKKLIKCDKTSTYNLHSHLKMIYDLISPKIIYQKTLVL